ncbi:MAG: flagellar M-ring protein FliF [Pseudomonadota bacterium]|nr:flagellar M-ring protein FliF [Pseudomonadota bacterium]
MFGTAAFFAFVFVAWIYVNKPQWRVLYSNLNNRDGGNIINALSQLNVPYKMAEGGSAILVPSNDVYNTRLKLASKGLPRGSVVGFELLDNQKLGTSDFIEQVDYQRALEGELDRTISSISAVSAARVQLAIPRPSVFVSEQESPSASVLVSLYPGRTLGAGQVAGIERLIAASVPQLEAKNVTVVDQNGEVLSQPQGTSDGVNLNADQLDYVGQVEQALANRIQAIIAPIVGRNNVRAAVTADLDFSRMEQTAETFQPNGTPGTAAILSQQKKESTSTTPAPGGVVGSAANQPPGQSVSTAASSSGGTTPLNGTATTAGTVSTNSSLMPVHSRKSSTTNYDVDKTIQHSVQPAGSIKRLSVAVVVNYRPVVNRDGSTKLVPLNQSEMDEINKLVKGAMGFDPKRGDSLNIVNTAFSTKPVVALPHTPFYKNPDNIAIAEEVLKDLLTAGVVLIVFLSLRRMLYEMLAKAPKPVPQAAAPSFEAAAPRQREGYEQNLQAAKDLARQNPSIVANVVKDWMENE